MNKQTTFVPTEVSLTIDTRDFPMHPTSGVILRAAGARYDDRTTGEHTFKRYEGEAASFVPIGGGRVVLAAHGWYVRSDTREGQSVPFYLQPNLGGIDTLRSFTDYRFRDNNMVVFNAELRLALMVGSRGLRRRGNVAARPENLDLAKRSYGGGFLCIRAARPCDGGRRHRREGWRVSFRLQIRWASRASTAGR
jgi:hypothetical protein